MFKEKLKLVHIGELFCEDVGVLVMTMLGNYRCVLMVLV
jgi:hypothetical protein